MILLPSTRQRIAAVPFLFRAHDCLDETGLFALSYGQKVYAVHTRTGHAGLVDQAGRIIRAPGGAPRVESAWSNDGVRRPALYLEPAGTNLCIRSQEIDTWTNSLSCTVTADGTRAPDGSTTAELVTATATGSTRSRSVTFTADGVKAVAVYVKEFSSSARSQFGIYDSTVGTARHYVNVTWSGGVPSLATASGSGTIFPVEALGNGWYRLCFSANGIIAANNHVVAIVPDQLNGTGSIFVWGYQTENATVPSSYVPTAGATVTRSADLLYFPYRAIPQHATSYARLIEQLRANAASPADATVWYVGAASGTVDPTLLVRRSVSGAGYLLSHDPATQTVTGLVGAATIRGDLIELRGELAASGACTLGASINSGAEAVNGPSTPQALGAAWSDTRLYFGSQGTANPGAVALLSHAVAAGTKSRDELRDLCEVG